MSTAEISAKPARRRRRTTSKPSSTQQWPIGPCGRPTPPAPRFIQIILLDGAQIWVSSRALARSGCIHCQVDGLIDAGYLRQGSPLTAPFTMAGEGDEGEYGARSGIELVAMFARLCASQPLMANCHHQGEC